MKNAESFESNTTGLAVPARRLSRKLSNASELNFASEWTTRSPSRVNLVRKESSTENQGTAGGQGRTRSQRTSLVSNMAGAAKLQQQKAENHSVVDKLNSSQDNPPSEIEKKRADMEVSSKKAGDFIGRF
ncbi:unnamed protein product [Oikopleura dioica]|uniref:Uncharacterized protein n=1 Tax=Oikopleura dioica TaxID=34765 RepID=E4WVV1_OIKDI|nr:unnamed protein product [Oikopleura dioica]